MELENITVSVYPHSVPHSADHQLEQLYQHVFSSFSYHAVYGNIGLTTSTYIAEKDGTAAAILLFRIEGGMVRILNEQLKIEPAEIARFCRYMFSMHPFIERIVFPAVENRIGRLPFPYQQARCSQNIVLTLPDTREAYLESLGKSTRSYVKRYLNKLKRSFSEMSCRTYEAHEASESDIRAIIALNRLRMTRRRQSSYIDHGETEKIIRLARRCGLVNVITINGRVCAGTINYRFGENYFLQVVAHDPAYDEFGLGTLCCYLSICECIARKGREFHFLWGRYEYKYRLLGVQRDLRQLVIYRSHARLLRNSSTALKLVYKDYSYGVRDWLERKARRKDDSSLSGRLAFYCLNRMKEYKRMLSRMRAKRNGFMEAPMSLQKE